jgi:hypothetical protein
MGGHSNFVAAGRYGGDLGIALLSGFCPFSSLSGDA